MTFDEWAAEAGRTLRAWNPEPAVRPGAATARYAADRRPGADPDLEPAVLELAPAGGPRPGRGRRRLLGMAAAAIVVVAVAIGALAVRQDGSDVEVGPQAAPTEPAPETTPPATEPVDPPPSGEAQFQCAAVRPDGEPSGASTDVFDAATDVATWQAVDIDGPASPASTAASGRHVQGTLVRAEGEDLTDTRARGAAFIAELVPGWGCTLWSPAVDVADASQPGPIVDEDGSVTNRMGGMCFVPDASADPDSEWGVDPGLAAALDQVVGLTDWQVVLADAGGNNQGPGRLWLEYRFEADPSLADPADIARVEADVTAAVAAAGASAGVATECTNH